jgi:glycerol-3-phosphate acyltransferase PlsY
MHDLVILIAIILAYLLGSINFAIIISKMMRLDDPRLHGSGNPGATNVLRSGHGNAAVIVLLGDAIKGLVAIIIARFLQIDGFSLGLVGLAVLVGHIYPIFFRFKGGKGVATMLGVFLGLNPALGVLSLFIWVVVAFLFRYSSLAALSAAVLSPALTLLLPRANDFYFLPLVAIAVLVVYRHRDNIDRLRHRKEGKIAFKSNKRDPRSMD